MHQDGEDHHAGDQVGEVDDVGKGLLRSRYLNPCSDLFLFIFGSFFVINPSLLEKSHLVKYIVVKYASGSDVGVVMGKIEANRQWVNFGPKLQALKCRSVYDFATKMAMVMTA